jgi:geranylgeranyl pyrophosphate synthase
MKVSREHAKFGELIGMAFQIKDDLFDYTDEAIGKPTGIDIKEQNDLALYSCFKYLYFKRKVMVDQL